MRNLFNFLWRIRVLVLFILLECFAMYFVIKQNVYHSAAFFNTTMSLNARISTFNKNIIDYFHLRQENDNLLLENAYLRSQLKNSFLVSNQKVFTINDTLYRQQYRYFTASVISYTTNQRNNYLTIDKGKNQGVKDGMGIYSPQGVIGVVDYANDNYSLVKSFLHSAVQVSAKIKNSGSVGTAVWDGVDFNYGHLNDIPLHVKMKKGDTLITSGFSGIFPEGILVGYVETVETDATKSFYKIKYKNSVDFSQISGVYVIENLVKDELDELEQRKKDNTKDE